MQAQRGRKVIAPDSMFRRVDLVKDLYSLKDTLLDCHPDPFAFCTKEEFNQAFNDAVSALPDPCPYAFFIEKVGEAMNVMRDSHTTLSYSYLQESQLENGRGLFGFRLYSDKGRFFVDRDLGELLKSGDEVLCINNIPVNDFFRRVNSFGCIEGEAITGQRRVTEAVMPIVAGIMFPELDSVKVDVLNENDSIVEYLIPRLEVARVRELRRMSSRSWWDSTYQVRWGNNGKYAYLRVGSFAPSGGGFSKFIKRTFKEMQHQGTEQLILDIRDNSGGSSGLVEYLYSFLDTAGYNTPHNIIARASPLARKRSNLDSGFSRFMLRTFYKKNENVQAFMKAYFSANGTNDTLFFKDAEKQKKKLVFTGKTYLLINGLTASAGVDFTNVFLSRKRGIVIGEPCLGPDTGTFGNATECTLKNTGLVVSIATIRYNYDASFNYHRLPLKPDYFVPMNPDDIRNKRDTQIRFTEDLILKK